MLFDRARSVFLFGLTVPVLSLVLGGCSQTGPQVTHHWVSQDKVAGSVYRTDVAACSSTATDPVAEVATELDPASSEFSAYQACMNERGYALVAASDVGELGRE